MAADYLLIETGDKLIVEDASGDLILESSATESPSVSVNINRNRLRPRVFKPGLAR